MHDNPEKTIAVAVSGGIDSLVAAFLLKQSGFDVFGMHFTTGYESAGGHSNTRTRIDHLSRTLGITVHSIDIRDIFEARIVNYFVSTYSMGKTPNPCMRCNRDIKFGIMLDYAGKLGARRLATGHYARTEKSENGRFALKRGVDLKKDQSYFLAMLDQGQLAQSCFILGDKTKTDVRQIAETNNIHPFFQKESQDICFIKKMTAREFLTSRLQNKFESGEIVDAKGYVIGRHNGLFHYTIGQRRGINCPGPQAYYVTGIDIRRNRLVVGFKDELCKKRCTITNVNWIKPRPSGPVAVTARIRYRHKAVESVLTHTGRDTATIDFSEPQPAVTPGQAAVCYQGDEVVAAGWIENGI